MTSRATIALKGSVPWKERSDFKLGKNILTLRKSQNRNFFDYKMLSDVGL